MNYLTSEVMEPRIHTAHMIRPPYLREHIVLLDTTIHYCNKHLSVGAILRGLC